MSILVTQEYYIVTKLAHLLCGYRNPPENMSEEQAKGDTGVCYKIPEPVPRNAEDSGVISQKNEQGKVINYKRDNVKTQKPNEAKKEAKKESKK